MRATTFPVRNTQHLEVFTRPRGEQGGGFEMWMVGSIRGERTMLDHFLTREDCEKQLCYARPGDLLWHGTDEAALPTQQTAVARENEGTIRRGVFWNAVALCVLASDQLPVDRKAANAAKKHLVGEWTDGTLFLTFEPEARLRLALSVPSLPDDYPLRFFYNAASHDGADTWHFGGWSLFLMNEARKCGQRSGLWRCDEQELHLFSCNGVLAHVLRRV